MPEMYGTHHSKMIVLFRHDDLAQVILLTANFIERDWRMSQAIWRTPLLPLQHPTPSPTDPLQLPPLGSGPRFKDDLLAYYRGYGTTRLHALILQLQQYDFSEVRGALIASVPGRHPIHALDTKNTPVWGWPALKNILSCIPPTNTPPPPSNTENQNQPQIIIQISSIASLGDHWLSKTLLPTLSTTLPTHPPPPPPKFSIIFPTPSEIRNSIDGYASGSSIHMKISSPAQAKQLKALKPMLCHWSSDQASLPNLNRESILHALNGHAQDQEQDPSPASHPAPPRTAHRATAAPHIKTYIRFTSPSMDQISWAILTSANLSTQAWGAASTVKPGSGGGDIRICSYEIGVVVWPGLWDEGEGKGAEMVPVFGTNDPPPDEPGNGDGGDVGFGNVTGGDDGDEGTEGDWVDRERQRPRVRVGWRMPYDLPPVPYGEDEIPWSAEMPCREPDRFGRVWGGYGR